MTSHQPLVKQMTSSVFQKIRAIATQIGVASPESDEQIYSVSFFGSIERRIRKLYEDFELLNKELDASKDREKELEDIIRDLTQWKPAKAWEASVEAAKAKLDDS